MAQDTSKTRYGIEELAKLGGVSRRTVRYYVQRGLLPTPQGTGRGKHYTSEHLDTLLKIKELQERGVPLAKIPAQLRSGVSVVDGGSEGSTARISWAPEAHQSVWTRIELDDGIELHLKGGRVLDSHQLARLSQAVLEIVGGDQRRGK